MGVLDGTIEKAFFIRADDGLRSEFDAFFNEQAKHHSDMGEPDAVFKYMDDLDNKCSALLTHVSMLIAAMGVMMAIYDDPYSRTFLLIEIAIYVFVAAGLLRCVRILHPRNISISTYLFDIRDEVIRRYAVYQRARLMTIIATIVLFIAIVIKTLSGWPL